MTIESAYAGEDVPITVAYTSGGSSEDPDSAPTITITENSSGTDVVSDAAMTGSAGDYEYVWDSDTDGNGAGLYVVTVTAEFDAETKIVEDTIELL